MVKFVYAFKFWMIGTLVASFAYVVMNLAGWSLAGSKPQKSLSEIGAEFLSQPLSFVVTTLTVGALLGYMLGRRRKGAK
jgi:hypothetical protein